MGWTSPKTYGTEVATSDDMNTYVRDNTDYLYDYKPQVEDWVGGSDTTVAQLNQRLESGTADVPISQSTAGSLTISFNTAFGSAPRVLAAICNYGSTVYGAHTTFAVNVGTGGFDLRVSKQTSGTVTTNIPASWLAIGA